MSRARVAMINVKEFRNSPLVEHVLCFKVARFKLLQEEVFAVSNPLVVLNESTTKKQT